jgi:hypothetical protein
MKTEDVLVEMLTENTGTHMCDSGGTPKYDENGKYLGSDYGYGRHYERNKNCEFTEEPASTLSFRAYEYNNKKYLDIEVEHNIYHWLLEKLEYNEEVDNLFYNNFLSEVDTDDKCWYELIEEFPEWLGQRDLDEDEDSTYYGESHGFYGDGDPITVNSYNEDNLLSQVIQFKYFENEVDKFVVLQIHNGADVRGGYTKPRVFCLTDELSIFGYARANIFCTGKDHHESALKIKEQQERQQVLPGIERDDIDFDDCYRNWYTDDGCHYYENCTCGSGRQLETYETKELTEDDDVWERGKLCIKDGVGYCPECGAKLAISF